MAGQDPNIVYIRGELIDLETEEPIEGDPTALDFLESLDDYELSDDAYVNAILREVYGRGIE
jgi:hypothetical protein